MENTKIIENLLTFSDELGKIGLKISNEIYGQTYLEEEDFTTENRTFISKKRLSSLKGSRTTKKSL